MIDIIKKLKKKLSIGSYNFYHVEATGLTIVFGDIIGFRWHITASKLRYLRVLSVNR